jgi:hypothetical protein
MPLKHYCESEPDAWPVRTATVIPVNERWLHLPQAATDHEKALNWALANPASDANLDLLPSYGKK